MTNVEKAARIIRNMSEVDGETIGYAHAHNIAQTLADAGLLLPELPELVDGLLEYVEGAEVEVSPYNRDIYLEGMIYTSFEGTAAFSNPAHARKAAYALLAAANHAEEEA